MPLEQISPNTRRLVVSHPKRRGKTVGNPLSAAPRDYQPPPPKKRKISRHYTRQTIFQVLQFINFHTITYLSSTHNDGRVRRSISGTATRPGIMPALSTTQDRSFWDVVDEAGPWGRVWRQRSPTFQETSRHFLIPVRNIQRWWANRENIINRAQRPARKHADVPCAWPDLETALFDEFCQRRLNGKSVTRATFRRSAKRLFKELYPHCDGFTFSNGWFAGFLGRYGVVRRRLIHQATKLPLESIAYCNSFLRIMNLDEVPILFEYLDGYSYDFEGVKTVSGKTDRSGWSKRQATLILYIFADGVCRIPPKIIFHAAVNTQLRDTEGFKYNPDVTVEYNPTAYNNEDLFRQFIDEELAPILTGDQPNLLAMDVAAFYKTDAIRERLKELSITPCFTTFLIFLDITPAMIPGGMTSLLQPLDTHINAVFKRWLREAVDDYVAAREQEQPYEAWSVSDKRVMTTHVVATAFQRLQADPARIIKSFKDCGISVAADGSEDHLIKIKDIPTDKIDLTGWEQAEDVTIAGAAGESDEGLDGLDEYITTQEEGGLGWAREKNAVLVDILKSMGLRHTGKKAVMVKRLYQAYFIEL
ncbi:hypothetical protein CONLIGDRAFT_646981 [Coniochaeta ligniaria NRRL 30616]|uniref:HTH CENPB-type domain-containing protein n=1 Tax=Coniochaeta ligniaria NRRL 30616 TaxID=1408157 RepID=A0A1J7JC68_9PEZI|nr:hypothetical protein CONLIGDRAFT_646981 [Coniochaeta ligniaria NRRL 30616]